MKKNILRLLLLASLAGLSGNLPAQVPQLISYQGRVLSNSTNFNGTGQFKFALVNGPGNVSYWSNDGTSAGGSEPTAGVSLPVASGLVTTLLGDTTLPGMTAIPSSIFANTDVRLRIWFNGGSGYQLLTPDQRIVSVGYAMMADTVPNGTLGVGKFAPGVFSPSNFPPNSVSSAELADTIALGATNLTGRLDVYRTSANTAAISLIGNGSQISTYGSDGQEQTRLFGASWGELLLNNSLANNATAVNLTAQGSTGGRLSLNNTNGSSRAILEGENTGGLLTLYAADGSIGAVLYGNEGAGSGALSLRNTNGSLRFRGYGGPSSGALELYDVDGTLTFNAQGAEGTEGSQLNMYQGNGTRTLQFDAENGPGGGGYAAVYSGDGGAATISSADSHGGVFSVYEEDGTLTTQIHNVANAGVVSLYNASGAETVYLWGTDSAGTGSGQIGLSQSDGTETLSLYATEGSTGGSQILLRKGNGVTTMQLDGEVGTTGGGYIDLRKSNGVVSIVLEADTGTVQGQVIEITGGSDFSEKFDIRGDHLEPGMIVSIDPQNPGQLVLTTTAQDKKVAGIISGAGGVKPGMLMGQRGSLADGKHPVALTGRVFCWADAEANGAIEPGDMLTTSATPGHGMKVTRHAEATGAIIGKAMTSLAKGKGLVLVLVNLQ